MDENPDDKYVILHGGRLMIQSTGGRRVVMFASNKGACGQGTWVVDEVPAGGFNVVPREWLEWDMWIDYCKRKATT